MAKKAKISIDGLEQLPLSAKIWILENDIEAIISRKKSSLNRVKRLMDGNEYRRDSVNWFILEGREVEMTLSLKELEELKEKIEELKEKIEDLNIDNDD